jgi:hypothetical protein
MPISLTTLFANLSSIFHSRAELQSSNDLFFPLLALPGAKVRDIGYGVRSDFELNFGRYLPSFGRTDDDTDKQPD